MQPLEDSLIQQDKLNPPYGECYHCHDMGHWIGDRLEAQKLREQQMSTNKKPAYRQCYICGLEDHWAPNCPKREDDLMIDGESQLKLVDYITESSDDEDNIRPPQRKRRAMVIYSDDVDGKEQQSSVSTEKHETESSVSTENPSRKRKASEPDISDISPKRRRLDTRKMKTVKRTKTGQKTYCFICESASHSP